MNAGTKRNWHESPPLPPPYPRRDGPVGSGAPAGGAVMAGLKVQVFPYRKNVGMGNVMWPGRYPMRAGEFPSTHPVGGGRSSREAGQYGDSEAMNTFRDRGYWASCFPEGDGITWEPLRGQNDEQCLSDIRDCFGWDTQWAPAFEKNAPYAS